MNQAIRARKTTNAEPAGADDFAGQIFPLPKGQFEPPFAALARPSQKTRHFPE
jgi:hypothetical protein